MIELLKYLCTVLGMNELVKVQHIISKNPRLLNKDDIQEIINDARDLEKSISDGVYPIELETSYTYEEWMEERKKEKENILKKLLDDNNISLN